MDSTVGKQLEKHVRYSLGVTVKNKPSIFCLNGNTLYLDDKRKLGIEVPKGAGNVYTMDDVNKANRTQPHRQLSAFGG